MRRAMSKKKAVRNGKRSGANFIYGKEQEGVPGVRGSRDLRAGWLPDLRHMMDFAQVLRLIISCGLLCGGLLPDSVLEVLLSGGIYGAMMTSVIETRAKWPGVHHVSGTWELLTCRRNIQ